MKSHPNPNTTTYRPFLERLGGSPVDQFVGEFGELFYDPTNPTLDSLRMSDGQTPGGQVLSSTVRDRIEEIYDMIDGSTLEKIQEVINNFIEVGIDEFSDVKDRIENLEDTSVRRGGDTMTGGLKIQNLNGYKYEIIPETSYRAAGTTKFTLNDVTAAEIYWDPENEHIDFSFPVLGRISNEDVMLEVGRDAVTIHTKTDIRGDLFVKDVDVLSEIDKVKLELATELLGKVDKAGDTMTGALTLSGDPTADLHAATKKYVDTTTIPFNMRKLSALPN